MSIYETDICSTTMDSTVGGRVIALTTRVIIGSYIAGKALSGVVPVSISYQCCMGRLCYLISFWVNI